MHIKDMLKSARYVIISAFLLPVMLGAVYSPGVAANTDCDDNAVIYCGASSVRDLMHKYNKGDGHNRVDSIHHIYDAFGISGGDVRAMQGNSRTGTVTKSGDVYVGGKLVATGAMTAGRQDMNGSHRRSNGGTTFYTRSPDVSFQSDRLQALVVMQGDNFRFAILTSCGNPVIATPHHPHNDTPPKHPGRGGIGPSRPVSHRKQTPRTTTVNNTNVCNGDTNNDNSGVASQGGNCSTNTTNNTTNTSVTQTQTVDRAFNDIPESPPPAAEQTEEETPPPTVAATPSETVSSAPASVTTPSVLPNTGPGSILGIFGATTAVGTLAYRAYLRRQLDRL